MNSTPRDHILSTRTLKTKESEIAADEKSLTYSLKMQEMQDYIKKLEEEVVELKDNKSKEKTRWQSFTEQLQCTIEHLGTQISEQNREIFLLKIDLKESMEKEEDLKSMKNPNEEMEREISVWKKEIEKLNELLVQEREQSVIMHQSTIKDFEVRLKNGDSSELKTEIHGLTQKFELEDLKRTIGYRNEQIKNLKNDLERLRMSNATKCLLKTRDRIEKEKHSQQVSMLQNEITESLKNKNSLEEEMNGANDQILMILEHHEDLRASEAKKNEMEQKKLKKEIEDLKQILNRLIK